MSNIRKTYEQKLSEMNDIKTQLAELMKDERVKKYLELNGQSSKLNSELLQLYTDMKKEEFSECKHIWIPISKNIDYYEGRSDIDYGCVKCGLDHSRKSS